MDEKERKRERQRLTDRKIHTERQIKAVIWIRGYEEEKWSSGTDRNTSV